MKQKRVDGSKYAQKWKCWWLYLDTASQLRTLDPVDFDLFPIFDFCNVVNWIVNSISKAFFPSQTLPLPALRTATQLAAVVLPSALNSAAAAPTLSLRWSFSQSPSTPLLPLQSA